MNEAIKSLKAGDRKTAYRLLRRHLRTNPKDVNAWLWISQATTDRKKQIDALQLVLALAPQHPRAKAIRKRLRDLNNASPITTHGAPPSSESDSVEYPFDDLLAEVRAELEKHSPQKQSLPKKAPLSSSLNAQSSAQVAENALPNKASRAAVRDSEAEHTKTPALSPNNLKKESSKAIPEQETFSDENIDLILELKKSQEALQAIEMKEEQAAKEKAAKAKPSAKAEPSVVASKAPAAEPIIDSGPVTSLPAAEEAEAVETSHRKNLVLWMWGVLLLSIIVVVTVIFIMPNLPPSN